MKQKDRGWREGVMKGRRIPGGREEGRALLLKGSGGAADVQHRNIAMASPHTRLGYSC